VKIVHRHPFPELKKLLLTNDPMYAKIEKGIKKAYEEAKEDIPDDTLTLVVGIVSENPLPENFKNLEDYYYIKAKYGNLAGGGRRKRKSKKRKSKKRNSRKSRKSRKSRTRRRRR
jgi:hypothetical protein